MELRGYFEIVARRKWFVIITTITTFVIVVVGTLLMTPIYQATATLRVSTANQGSVDYLVHDITYTDRLMNTYAKIAISSPMMDALVKKLALSKPPSVKVDISANTELMQISVEDPNPALAESAANAMADLLVAYAKANDNLSDRTIQQSMSEQLTQAQDEVTKAKNDYTSLVAKTPNDMDGIAAASRLLKVKEDTYANLLALNERVRMTQSVQVTTVSVIEPAAIPESPSQPKKPLNIALGLLVGIAGGLGLAFLFENLDATLYTTEQIETATDRSIFGRIPVANLRTSPFINGTSPGGEAFRHIRTTLLNLNQGSSLHTLLVTSAEPGEGKSTIAANVANTLTESGRKVLLVDCDLRAPTLHKILGLPNKSGLSDVLTNKVALNEALQYDPRSGIWALTSGDLPHNPAELLGLPSMTNLIQLASERFDIVVLDTPSLLAVTDAAVLAPAADVVVLVVARAHVRQNEVKAACRILDKVKAKQVGVIVNRTEADSEYHYYAQHRRG